jgi:hypothetical protein
MASKPRRQRNSTGLPIQLGPSSLTSIFRPKKTEEPPRGRPDLYASLTDLRPVRRKVQLVSRPGQVRQRRHLHLPDDLAAVDFYSNLADADVVRDLPRRAGDQNGDRRHRSACRETGCAIDQAAPQAAELAEIKTARKMRAGLSASYYSESAGFCRSRARLSKSSASRPGGTGQGRVAPQGERARSV